MEPGTPVQLVIPPGAASLTVTHPDGTVTELVPAAEDGLAVTFAGTSQPGIYTVTPIPDPDASAAPSAAASDATTPRPAASPSAPVTAGASAPPDDPFAPVQFAVALFDVDESTIAPGSAAAIEALGTTSAAASPAPGSSATPGGAATTERPTSRDELWVPIVLIVLVVLCAEWALYHRDGLIRIRRSLAARLGRGAGATG